MFINWILYNYCTFHKRIPFTFADSNDFVTPHLCILFKLIVNNHCSLKYVATLLCLSPAATTTNSHALAEFSAKGISVWSSGGCHEKYNKHCTSFDGLQLVSLSGVLKFKQTSGCAITITGGTEIVSCFTIYFLLFYLIFALIIVSDIMFNVPCYAFYVYVQRCCTS